MQLNCQQYRKFKYQEIISLYKKIFGKIKYSYLVNNLIHLKNLFKKFLNMIILKRAQNSTQFNAVILLKFATNFIISGFL